jgi:hypothetical protein
MRILVAAFGIIAISSAALAQGAQPLSGPPASGPASQQQAPASGTAPPQQAPAPGTAPPQPRTIAQCRDDARSQRLRGDERKTFIRDCAREIQASCREQARAQRLDREARREFIVTCTGRPSRNAQRPGTDAAPPPSNMQSPEPSSGGTQAPAPR